LTLSLTLSQRERGLVCSLSLWERAGERVKPFVNQLQHPDPKNKPEFDCQKRTNPLS